MATLSSIPYHVMVEHLYPCLDHNDLLRLRGVCKQTKAFADDYLKARKPCHQGKWELKIDYRKKSQPLQAFLQLDLPSPPTRLYIVNKAEKVLFPSPFFQDVHLKEFMERYGKYITELRLNKLFIPFTSDSEKEIGFYKSLVNLEKLCCEKMITVGAKTRNANQSFFIPPTFKNLKVFKLNYTDCMDNVWNFVNELTDNLEELMHPFQRRKDADRIGPVPPINFGPAQDLIERRGMKDHKLVYDWTYLEANEDTDPLSLLRLFARCRDNGVMIRNLRAGHLDHLLFDGNGRIGEVFVGNVIQSLVGVSANLFRMEMEALEDITFSSANYFQIDPRRVAGDYPEWPNLRKMHVRLEHSSEAHFDFLFGEVSRPKLEELCLSYKLKWVLPQPMELGNCGNLKKLSICCPWNNDFFLGLWEGLPLLEDVALLECTRLTNKGFIGNGVAGRRSVFLKLKNLKHLTILNLEMMPRLTNAIFKQVFRHLKLSSFKLSSEEAISSITVAGIKELLTGPFSETIEKIDLKKLRLENVCKKELRKVLSLFRCSEMM